MNEMNEIREMDEEDTDILSEDEVPELHAPYAMAFGVQITDSRLSDGEFRFLLWLRFRSFQSGENYVKYSTYAEDLGVDERTVRKWSTHLQQLGHIRCESRGFARSHKKILVAPSKLYGERLVKINKLLSKDRTPGDILTLRSAHVVPEFSYRIEGAAHSGLRTPPVSAQNARSYTDLSETDSSESSFSQPIDASHRPGCSTKSKEDHQETTREKEKNKESVEKSGKTRDSLDSGGKLAENRDSDTRKETAQKIAQAVLGEEAKQRSLAKVAEIRRRRQEKAEQDTAETAKAKARKTNRFVTKDGAASAVDVTKLFDELMGDNFPDVPIGKWDIKDLTLAKRLLDAYGQDLTGRVIRWVFEAWPKLRTRYEKNDFGPVPTIQVLYGWRKKWFAEKALDKARNAEPSNPDKWTF